MDIENHLVTCSWASVRSHKSTMQSSVLLRSQSNHHILCVLVGLLALVMCQAFPFPPPEPLLPIPSARQLAWQQRELMMFFHFGMNTFTNQEWGDGTENPADFNPTKFDARQWIQIAKEAGFKAVVLTAKHHDGFCLWPSDYTNHSVQSTLWRGGRGDVVQELARAAYDAGLGFGLYLSPWDRHQPTYGRTVEYNEYYMGQLRELLTRYGPVTEVWFDGAKGEHAQAMVYHFAAWAATVRQLQPAATMFSAFGPDVRWVGNEHGEAGPTCWSPLNISDSDLEGTHPGYLNRGDPAGVDWLPAECDVSIRDGWFWHPEEQPKSVKQLLSIYFHSVGRNCVLLLNVPPNSSGLISVQDVQRLREFRAALDEIFSCDLALGATATASSVRGCTADCNEGPFAPGQVLEADLSSFWAAAEGAQSAVLELDLGSPKVFNIARVQEPIAMGQRVSSYCIQALVDGIWRTLSGGSTIGYKRLDRFKTTIARRVRLVIKESRGGVLIASMGLYHSSLIERMSIKDQFAEKLAQPI